MIFRSAPSRLGLFTFLLAATVAAAADDRPNIVFFLTDDQRWDSVGAAGLQPVKTPAMDRIAREGVRFANAFVTTSLCSPSRASFMTGQYASVHGVMDNITDLPDSHPTLPQFLKKAGYATAFCGKWHMGNHRSDARPGYDFWASFKGQGSYEDPAIEVNGKQVKAKGWVDEIMTDHALRFLKQDRGGKPFFLYLSFKSTHQPWTPHPRFRDLYASTAFPTPLNFWDDMTGKPSYQQDRRDPREKRSEREERSQRAKRQYHATIAGADAQAGRVLDHLDQAGLAENTIVVFAGDNGYFHGEHWRGDKRLLYEESIRVPWLVRFPKAVKAGLPPEAPAGAKGGRVLDPMVLNVDLTPTLLDFAGVDIPKDMQGRSLRPWLEGNPSTRPDGLAQGGAPPWRTSAYFEYFVDLTPSIPALEGVRTTTAKYVRTRGGRGGAEEELYDLSKDPFEMKNLAADPSAKEMKDGLKTELARLKAEHHIPDVPDKILAPKKKGRK